MFCLELRFSVDKYHYSPIDAAIQLSVYISKQNYETSVVQEIYISRLELERQSLEFFISFFKVYIWDLGLRFG
jgi:hypothetical protein